MLRNEKLTEISWNSFVIKVNSEIEDLREKFLFIFQQLITLKTIKDNEKQEHCNSIMLEIIILCDFWYFHCSCRINLAQKLHRHRRYLLLPFAHFYFKRILFSFPMRYQGPTTSGTLGPGRVVRGKHTLQNLQEQALVVTRG